jgi:chromosome segregation ATPase
MTTPLRRLARTLYALPLLGRVVQWFAVLLRLPSLQRQHNALALRQDELQRQIDLQARQAQEQQVAASAETAAVQVHAQQLEAALVQLQDRVGVLEAALPRLESSTSRLLDAASVQDNLSSSVPVALRRSARDIAALRGQLAQLQAAADARAKKEPA